MFRDLFRLMLSIFLVISSVSKIYAGVLTVSDKAPPDVPISINKELIASQTFLWNGDVFSDMHVAQIFCEPRIGSALADCHLVFYVQGGKVPSQQGKAFLSQFVVNYDDKTLLSSDSLQPASSIPVTCISRPDSKVMDPMLIVYKGQPFVLSIRKKTAEVKEFLSVELSYNKEGTWHQSELDLVDGGHYYPESTWFIQDDNLILGGRYYSEDKVATNKGEEIKPTSHAAIITKQGWAGWMDKYLETGEDESLRQAFSGFAPCLIKWAEDQAKGIKPSDDYFTLQPDIIRLQDGSVFIHLRSAEVFPDRDGSRIAYSLIIHGDSLDGPFYALSKEYNPWAKNTLVTFNKDNDHFYLVGNKVPSSPSHYQGKETGKRNKLNFYTINYQKATNSFVFTDEAPIASVPDDKDHYSADLTFAYFDKVSQMNDEMKDCLFVGTLRTKDEKAQVLYWLKKPR